MEKVKKIGLIAVISLFSVFLLVVFVMVNFPYEAVIRRIDNTLARRQGARWETHRPAGARRPPYQPALVCRSQQTRRCRRPTRSVHHVAYARPADPQTRPVVPMPER